MNRPRNVLFALFSIIALAAPLQAGTVKIATNLGGTHYFQEQNCFANLLQEFTGFGWTPGGDSSDDCVPRHNAGIMFIYHPANNPGMWPDSTDDPATWYKLCYHCDSSKNKVVVSVFTIAKPPLNDGHGNWTEWLKFKEADAAKPQRIDLSLIYDPTDLGARGQARHGISRLKLLLPGCTEDDFLNPVFKQRLTGFARLRFCDTLYMNGRPVSSGLDVPGTRNQYELEGQPILRATTLPANAQNQTYIEGFAHNMSWGKGQGKGNKFSIWNGKTYSQEINGIGCLAPCELDYNLDKRYYLLQAIFNLDHEVDGASKDAHGDVSVEVWAADVTNPGPDDFKLLQRIKKLTTRTQIGITLDVTGKTRLKIKMIDNAGDGTGHVDILNPSLLYIQHWTDRTTPTICCGSTGPTTKFHEAMPYEFAIRMCNDLNADMWVNMPCTADDDYIHNFGNLMIYGSDPMGKVYTAADGNNPRPANPPAGWHPGLNKNLHLWLEDDNEVWNWGYACFHYFQVKGSVHKCSTYEQYASDAKHISDLLKPAFAAAGQSANFKMVFSNQLNGGWGDHETDQTFLWMEKKFGPVSNYFDYYAEAPYCGTGGDWQLKPPPRNMDQMFQMAQEYFNNTINVIMPNMARRAARWKLGVTTYEGGYHFENGPIPWIRGGRLSPRAGMIYDQYLQAWQNSCGKDAIYQEYSMFSNYEGDLWPFIAIQYCGPGMKGSVVYDALLRNSHPAGDVDLDGKVTYADFKTLAANFGGDGVKDKRYWSQGDFDNNQCVGLDDLKLLLMNTDLNTWTADQKKELQSFIDSHPGPYILGPDPKTHQGTWVLQTWRNHPKSISIPVQEDSGGMPSSYVVITPPRHGTLDVDSYPAITYTPKPNYLGIDDFVIAAKDDKGVQSNPIWIDAETNVAADPSLLANYHCDEGAGTTITDSGGNTGTLVNTVTWTTGKTKNALAFSWAPGPKLPVPGYVKIGNAPAPDGTAYTLSLWVRPDEIPTAASTGAPMQNLATAAGLIGKPCPVNFDGLCFMADPKNPGKGRFALRHVLWFSASAKEIDSGPYAPGEWHHVVGVVDPTAQDLAAGQPALARGVMRLYVDGQLVAKTHGDVPGAMQCFTHFGTTDGSFYLGVIQPGDDKARDSANCRGSFKGAIEQVRIYKRGLSDDEVAALYDGVISMPPTVAVTQSLVGQNIILQAQAIAPDGDVAKVDYYISPKGAAAPAFTKLNTSDIAAAPFTFTWKDVKQGDYLVQAVATADTGLTTTSKPITITLRN